MSKKKDLFDPAVVNRSTWMQAHEIDHTKGFGDRTMTDREQIAKAGWRSCIDHIIKPESPCPVCKIERLQKAMRATILEMRNRRGHSVPVHLLLDALGDEREPAECPNCGEVSLVRAYECSNCHHYEGS